MAILKRRRAGVPNYMLRNRLSAPASDYLLVHVTGVGAAREIIRAGYLETRFCSVFKRNLIYFFVLRPAYKLRNGESKQSIIDYFPAIFLVSTKDCGSPYHLYPFDTGGALDGAFDEGASPAVFLEDYQLEESFKAASEHIRWAFGSNTSYYDGNLKKNFDHSLAHWDVGATTFAKIARLASAGHNRPDRRASAIEVAFDTNFSLDQLRLVILPTQFLEDRHGRNMDMIDRLSDADIKWQTYDWRPNQMPSEFHTEINAIVREYLLSEGQIL